MNRAVENVAAGRPRLCLALCLALASVNTARAQVDPMPDPGYVRAVNEFYSGQYRDAARVFRRMTRTGV